MVISSNDWDELQRLLEEQQAEEQAAKPTKVFQHKPQPPNKCYRPGSDKMPACTLLVRIGSRDVCQGTGQTVTDMSGVGKCAHSPIARGSSGEED